MPTLADVFTPDVFGTLQLTQTVNELPFVPGRLGQLGLFEEQGIPTTVAMIEYQEGQLMLVPNQPRGGKMDNVVEANKRRALPVTATHLPQRATIYADEVLNVRAFGTNDSNQAIEMVRNDRMTTKRQNLEATHEWHRVGALKGKVLDADGSTEIIDLFAAMGLVQQTTAMVFGTATTNIRGKITEAMEKVEDELGGTPFTGLRALCGIDFWKALIDHAKVRDTYLGSAQAADMRGNPLDAFDFGGITWERYRGKINSVPYIGNNDAYLVPQGVPGLFISRFAPADYMEAAGTIGLPLYSKARLLEFDKGIEIEMQSNPIHLCTRPRSIVKLTVA
jgi:hypothetical protein